MYVCMYVCTRMYVNYVCMYTHVCTCTYYVYMYSVGTSFSGVPKGTLVIVSLSHLIAFPILTDKGLLVVKKLLVNTGKRMDGWMNG